MQNFQDTLEKGKQSFIRAFSICMTVPLNKLMITITKMMMMLLIIIIIIIIILIIIIMIIITVVIDLVFLSKT